MMDFLENGLAVLGCTLISPLVITGFDGRQKIPKPNGWRGESPSEIWVQPFQALFC
jgi:hypothetical protein